MSRGKLFALGSPSVVLYSTRNLVSSKSYMKEVLIVKK